MRSITAASAARALLALAVACALACGESGPVCDEDDGPNLLEIGDTSLANPAEFVVLESGESMRVVITAHGFFALRPAIRVSGLWPGEDGRIGHSDDPRVSIHAYLGEDYLGGTNVSAETGLQLDEEPHYGFAQTGEGAELLSVDLVFLDGIEPLDYLNQPLDLRGDVTDACGETASARLDVVAHWQY